MRALVIFLIGVALVFGLLAAIVIVTRGTERVFVVVDNSFAMRDVWSQVPGALSDIESEGFTEYALATEKELVHAWQDGLTMRAQDPYAPCDFSEIAAFSQATDADQRVLVTTASSCPTDGLTEWRIVELRP